MNEFYEYLEETLKEGVLSSQKALKNNSERFWTVCNDEYEKLGEVLNNDDLTKAFKMIVNEILLQQMHSLLVAMDGGAWISEKYSFEIVDKNNGTIVNENIALHDMFLDYLWDKNDGDPFRTMNLE